MTKSVAAFSQQLVVCVKNAGYEASLELRKLYSTIPDPDAKKHKLLRVIDESGEDYLYHQVDVARLRVARFAMVRHDQRPGSERHEFPAQQIGKRIVRQTEQQNAEHG